MLPFGDVRGDATDASDSAVPLLQRELDGNVVVNSIIVRSVLFECERFSGGEYGAVIRGKLISYLLRKDLVIRLPDRVSLL